LIKYLALFSLLFLAAGCEEEVPMYDRLTPAEQTAIQTIARDRCMADTLDTYTDFKTNSNTQMMDFSRGQHWKVSYAGSPVVDSYIYVWKVSATAVYFLFKENIQGVLTYNFIKMTPTLNGLMIDDMRKKKCYKDTSVSSISATSATITFKTLNVESTVSSVKYKTDSTYTATIHNSVQQPMFFANFAKRIAKKKLDVNGNVASTENFNYTLTYVGDTNETDLEPTYNDPNYNNNKYCVVDYNNAVGPDPITFDIPYALNCVSGDSAEVNTGTSIDVNFTPNLELNAPFEI
jgi:hypothetical protein